MDELDYRDLREAMTCKICGRLLSGFLDIRIDPKVPFFVMPDGEAKAGPGTVKIAACQHHKGAKTMYREQYFAVFGEYPEGIEEG